MSERWIRKHVEAEESILTLLGTQSACTAAEISLRKDRMDLKTYIKNHPEFQTSLEPLPWDPNAPEPVREMIEAGGALNVGPMAAVAGVLAGRCLRAMISVGDGEAVVDNGGDMAMLLRSPLLVGVYAGEGGFRNLAFEIKPGPHIQALSASSGTVGHSYSRGRADIAVVFSESPALADAAATALANHVRNADDLAECFHFIDVPGIEGAFVVFQDRAALWGYVPEILHGPVDFDLITRGR